MEIVLEFLGIVLVIAVVYCATQSESPREIARESGRFALLTVGGIALLSGLIAIVSAL